jgi:hypothetical protein
MALPLFQFKADSVDLSGVELNLGTAGAVISTALNSDHLNLTSSSLNFSNALQTFTVSKDGLDTVSADLLKTVSLLNGNASTKFLLTDFTANVSYPNKTMLTPLGMTITGSGETGEVVHMNASSITVGGTSVTWANVISSGAELQDLQAIVTPPNANTIAIVNTLLLESNVPAPETEPDYKIVCSAVGPTSITQTNVGLSVSLNELVETTLSNSQLEIKYSNITDIYSSIITLTSSTMNISQISSTEGNSFESLYAMNQIIFANGPAIDAAYGVGSMSINDRTDPLLIKESNYLPDQISLNLTINETDTKSINITPDGSRLTYIPSIYGTGGAVNTEMNTGQFSIIDDGPNGLSKILSGDLGLVQESSADQPEVGNRTTLNETSLIIEDKLTTSSSVIGPTGITISTINGLVDLTVDTINSSVATGYTITSISDLSLTGENVALNVSAGNVKLSGTNLLSPSSAGASGQYLNIVINDVSYKLPLWST